MKTRSIGIEKNVENTRFHLGIFICLLLAACHANRINTVSSVMPGATQSPHEVAPAPTMPPRPANWQPYNDIAPHYRRMAIVENGLFFALGGQGGFIYKGGLGVDYETIFPKVYEGGNGWGTSIDAISAEDAWAAFNWGQMFHWDGTQWTSVELPLASPGYTNFYEIKFSDENNGWVIGKGPSELNGPANSLILLHWDGKQWSDVTDQLLETYPDLSVDQEELEFPLETVSSKSVWLGSGDHVLHWDGSTWNRISTPEGMQGIVSIAVLDDKYIWALSHTIQKTGDGEKIDEAIFIWDGNEWKKSQIQSFSRDFRYSGKLLIISMDNVWLASKGLFHWNGKEWEDMAYDGKYGPIMDMDTDGRVWALTEAGIILELKYPE